MQELNLSKYSGLDWDKHNSPKIKDKHSVEYFEIEQVILNGPVILYAEAPKNGIKENRYMLLGITDLLRGLSIIVTPRGNLLRPISARPMSKKERRIYEEEIKKDPEV